MLHEFMVMMEGKFEEKMSDIPCLIDMDRIESCCPGSSDAEIGKTIVMLKSSASLVACIPYEDFCDIWRTCIEPININQ